MATKENSNKRKSHLNRICVEVEIRVLRTSLAPVSTKKGFSFLFLFQKLSHRELKFIQKVQFRGGVMIEFSEMRGPNKIFGSFCEINEPNILFGPLISENSTLKPPLVNLVAQKLQVITSHSQTMHSLTRNTRNTGSYIVLCECNTQRIPLADVNKF